MNNFKPSRNDIQKEYIKYMKNLEFNIENYRKKFVINRSINDAINLIYNESELLLKKKEDDDIKQVKFQSLKTLLDELVMLNENNKSENANSENKNIKNNLLYPEIGDKEFGYKIFHKKEFNQFKIPKLKIDNLNE